MTLYQTIKEAVAKIIKTNGNQEITGYLLQRQLFSIIDALGEGYMFMGEAKPGTDPGVPDHKVAYLAIEKGTYENFGATVIDDEQPFMYLFRLDGPNLLEPIAITGKFGYDTIISLIDKAKGATTEELAKLADEVSDNYDEFSEYKANTSAALSTKADEESVAERLAGLKENVDTKADKTELEKLKSDVENDFQQQTETFNAALALKFDKANVDTDSLSDSDAKVPSSKLVAGSLKAFSALDYYGMADKVQPLIFVAEEDLDIEIPWPDIYYLYDEEFYVSPDVYDTVTIADFGKMAAQSADYKYNYKSSEDKSGSVTLHLDSTTAVAIFRIGDPSSHVSNTPFRFTGKVKCYGSVMAVLGYAFNDEGYYNIGLSSINIVSDYALWQLFKDCTTLIKAPNLPATKVGASAYKEMFKGCTSLTEAPELPATELGKSCYESMFEGCTALTKAPSVLPAKILESGCYKSMFKGCIALTKTLSTLPAPVLAISCYESMFENCTQLKCGPDIKAVIAPYIYQKDVYYFYRMFAGCSSLLSVPKFNLGYAVSDAPIFYGTFLRCKSLTAVDLFSSELIHAGSLFFGAFDDSGITSFKAHLNLISGVTDHFSSPLNFGRCESLSYIELKIISGKELVSKISDDSDLTGLPEKGTFITNVEGLAKKVGIPSTWDIVIEDQPLDKELSSTSTNAPQTKVVKAAIDDVESKVTSISSSLPTEATSDDITEILNS